MLVSGSTCANGGSGTSHRLISNAIQPHATSCIRPPSVSAIRPGRAIMALVLFMIISILKYKGHSRLNAYRGHGDTSITNIIYSCKRSKHLIYRARDESGVHCAGLNEPSRENFISASPIMDFANTDCAREDA